MIRVARLTLAYYAFTTIVAVLLGILLVVLIQPGKGSPFSQAATGAGCETTPAQACLCSLARMMCPKAMMHGNPSILSTFDAARLAQIIAWMRQQ